MSAGVLRGKRYSRLQVLSVVVLTIGVLVSAWADSESKVRSHEGFLEFRAQSTYISPGQDEVFIEFC